MRISPCTLISIFVFCCLPFGSELRAGSNALPAFCASDLAPENLLNLRKDTLVLPDTLDPRMDQNGSRHDHDKGHRHDHRHLPLASKTSHPDSVSATAIPWYHEQDLLNPFQLKPNYVDTTLLDFQRYDFAKRKGSFYAHKGNVGLVHRHLVFNPLAADGPDFGQERLYGAYLFTHADMRFYRPAYVYTDLFYVTGAETEQLFYARHAQKLHETFHMGFSYQLVNSPGAYSRLASKNAGFYATADYLSPNKRYQALGSFVVNRIFNQESLGLRNHLNFEEDNARDSVFLYRAESRYRDIGFQLHHFYQTGFYTSGDQDQRFVNMGRINHQVSYNRHAFVYEDKSAPMMFYPVPPRYTEQTFDSTTVHRFENLVSWSNFPLESGRGQLPFNFRVYLKHRSYRVQQPDWPENAPLKDTLGQALYYYGRNSYNEIVQGAELQTDQNRFLSLVAYINTTLGGYHDEDVNAGTSLSLGKPGQIQNLKLGLNFSSRSAPYFYHRFRSNQLSYDANFNKMRISNARVLYRLPWIHLQGDYYLLENMVYVGPQGLPVQNTGSLGVFSLAASSDLRLGWLGLRNHVVLQRASSERFEPFPELISYHSLYADFALFDKALLAQIGFDFNYNSNYKAMPYMPLVRSFFVQEQQQLQGRMLLDAFFNAKIKRARLFLKMENLLGFLPDTKPHYDIPYYPLPTSMFKFGVSWMFYD